MTGTSLSARERPGAAFIGCARRDSPVLRCPVLAAFRESHNRRLSLSFWESSTPVLLGTVYPCRSGENDSDDVDLLLRCSRK